MNYYIKLKTRDGTGFVPRNNKNNMAKMTKKQIIVFKIERENWALEVLKVQEIIRIVEVTSIPNVPVFLEGIINLRGKIVPVVNLRKIMNLPAGELDINAKIIIVEEKDLYTGFIIDAIEDIIEIETGEVESAGPVSSAKDFIKEIIKIEGKLIFLLNINKVLELGEKSFSGILGAKDNSLEQKTGKINYDDNETRKILRKRALDLSKVTIEENAARKNKIIVFSLNNEWYGVEEVKVREILNIQKIFIIPQAPDYIEGVINIRGTIVPVIKLSKFLGMKKNMIVPSSKILVVEKNNMLVGLLVDAIDEIIQLDWDILQHSFTAFVQEKTMFAKGEFQWQDKVVTVLDVESVIDFKIKKSVN